MPERLCDIDTVIVAHNAGDLLLDAVRSVVADLPHESVRVMDAESTDGAPQAVAAALPGVEVAAVSNLGFSASNNAGAALGSAPWLLFLNPDAVLTPGALRSLWEYARDNPGVGVVGPKVMNPDGSRQANQSGRYPSLAQVAGLRAWRVGQKLAGNDTMSPADWSSPKSVDWLTGACMLVRRDVFERIGGFDEGFFLYYEDVDLCHRVHDAGYDVVALPEAEVVHHLGQSGVSSEFVARAYRESFYHYCDKYGLTGLKAAARALLSEGR